MSVLVTGGAGYIGSHMVWQLVDSGAEVVVVDNLKSGFEWAVAPEAVMVEGDCGDQDLIARLINEHKVDSIIHFAGSLNVRESVSIPLHYYFNNTVKSRALIETAVTSGLKHFIFSSSAAVYGTPDSFPVSEDAPLKPESPYGWSKLMTETMLADAAAAHGLRYAALRYFNVAGADPRGRTGESTKEAFHLIKVACEAALDKRDGITIYGTDYDTPDGTCLRDYIHVTDLVDAHAEALAALQTGTPSLVVNCGYGHGFSVIEVVDAVKRISGRDFPVTPGARRSGDPAALVASPDRIREKLDWQPRFDNLDAIVETAFRWEEALSRRNQH